MMGMRNRVASALAVMALIVLGACEAQYRSHGYIPPEEDLEKLVVGVDTRAAVDDVIGAPSASGLLSDGDYYYVRTRFREYGMYEPEIIDRRVLAISFHPDDTIRNIEVFGLERGNVVPISRRVTDSSVVGNGLIRQIFGNFGNIDPTQLFQ
ncbi:outer membrane protein assembly factor BamE domain-containing protein [Roseovarius salis]|uniref:outer membrane protein assembly factor BamE n=1 Tax=Roseovarius salis TaxID=3376063 RepID=UPI0037C81BF7